MNIDKAAAEALIKHINRCGIPTTKGAVSNNQVLLPLAGDDNQETLDYLLVKRCGFTRSDKGHYNAGRHPFRVHLRGTEMLTLKPRITASLRALKPELSAVDNVTMDVPLMIRLMEHVREEVKSDTDLHLLAERVVQLAQLKTLTVGDFDEILNVTKDETAHIQVRTAATARLQSLANRRTK